MKPLLLPLLFFATSLHAAPLRLHPDNPHYFLFRDQPTVLITSGEHYGAVVNLGFDYVKYLDTLAADGLNLTRVFSGAYVEPQGAFNIAMNTLAPEPGRFVCPWARSDEAGYAGGGNKFDLMRWDPAYFQRLRDFVAQASDRGILVELTLFCPMYEEPQWKLSPMNVANNVNDIGAVGKHDAYDLKKNRDLQPIQEALVRKLVTELADADNVFFEICNEPYNGGVTIEWQHRIADVIADAEKGLTAKHLISQNISNGAQKIEKPHAGVSIFNFHYAHPPDAVAQNYALNKAIGDNETGFKGTADDHYRMEAWEFLLAGGALYNNLDYSFTAGHEDGTFAFPPKQPGGGNPAFRKQMKFLKEFIGGFAFLRMKPARGELKSAELSGGKVKGAEWHMLAEAGKQYAMYFKGAPGAAFSLELPVGKYRAEWFDVVSGAPAGSRDLDHSGGAARFEVPKQPSEVAARIVRLEP